MDDQQDERRHDVGGACAPALRRGGRGVLRCGVVDRHLRSMSRSGRRETVDLAVAGGGHHPPVGADRNPERIPGGRRRQITVQRVAVTGIEDQHRHPGAPLAGGPPTTV